MKVHTTGTLPGSSISFHKRQDDTTAGLIRSVTPPPSIPLFNTTASPSSLDVLLRVRREGRVFSSWWRPAGESQVDWIRIGQTSEVFTGRVEVGLFAAACHSNSGVRVPRVEFLFFGDPERTQQNQESSCRTTCLNLNIGELVENSFRLHSSAKYLHACTC